MDIDFFSDCDILLMKFIIKESEYMFNHSKDEEELPRAMRKMQKEKEEREKFIEEENRKKDRNRFNENRRKRNRKSKHSKKGNH